ncbi:MAG: metal-dependent hydrolase, partial [Acidobacteriota bacterium]
MPFPVAHTLTGLIIASCSDRFPTRRLWFETLLVALLANLPDFDFILVWLTGQWDLHRAFSHSLVIAIIVGALTCLWYLGKLDRARWLLYSAVVFSHPLLDL